MSAADGDTDGSLDREKTQDLEDLNLTLARVLREVPPALDIVEGRLKLFANQLHKQASPTEIGSKTQRAEYETPASADIAELRRSLRSEIAAARVPTTAACTQQSADPTGTDSSPPTDGDADENSGPHAYYIAVLRPMLSPSGKRRFDECPEELELHAAAEEFATSAAEVVQALIQLQECAQRRVSSNIRLTHVFSTATRGRMSAFDERLWAVDDAGPST